MINWLFSNKDSQFRVLPGAPQTVGITGLILVAMLWGGISSTAYARPSPFPSDCTSEGSSVPISKASSSSEPITQDRDNPFRFNLIIDDLASSLISMLPWTPADYSCPKITPDIRHRMELIVEEDDNPFRTQSGTRDGDNPAKAPPASADADNPFVHASDSRSTPIAPQTPPPPQGPNDFVTEVGPPPPIDQTSTEADKSTAPNDRFSSEASVQRPFTISDPASTSDSSSDNTWPTVARSANASSAQIRHSGNPTGAAPYRQPPQKATPAQVVTAPTPVTLNPSTSGHSTSGSGHSSSNPNCPATAAGCR